LKAKGITNPGEREQEFVKIGRLDEFLRLKILFKEDLAEFDLEVFFLLQCS